MKSQEKRHTKAIKHNPARNGWCAMDVFYSTLQQMILMFLFILLGFFFKKRNLLPANANSTISKMENLAFMPCLVLNTFINRCTIKNLTEKLPFLLYSLFLLVIALVLAVLLTPLFSSEKNEKGIYRYSFFVANIAFMGNAVVEGVFGDDVLFNYLIFTLPINLFLNSIGISWLMPASENMSFFQKMLHPINVSAIVGILLGITSLPLPKVFLTFISTGSACMAPLAMILTGFVIGGYPLGKLLSQKKVYLVSLYRLVLMPLLFGGLCLFLSVPADIRQVLICAYAMPLGLNTIVIPAAYDGDTQLGASMALISNVLALATIPLIFLFLI
jgi:hypothetical protein